MAISPSLMKNELKNLSTEELEKKYEELNKAYCFNSKEEQINNIINNYLNISEKENYNSTKIALEELLKEKTGKEYKFEPKNFEISLSDIINFIVNPDTNSNKTLSNYFQILNEINEEEKMLFIVELFQDKNSLNEFLNEIEQTQNALETYNKYKEIAEDYVSKNSKIG